MSNRDQVEERIPALLAHEGVWSGTYRVVDLKGKIIEQHESRVECVFPDEGEFHYVQRNRFTWADGRVRVVEFGGTLDGELYQRTLCDERRDPVIGRSAR